MKEHSPSHHRPRHERLTQPRLRRRIGTAVVGMLYLGGGLGVGVAATTGVTYVFSTINSCPPLEPEAIDTYKEQIEAVYQQDYNPGIAVETAPPLLVTDELLVSREDIYPYTPRPGSTERTIEDFQLMTDSMAEHMPAELFSATDVTKISLARVAIATEGEQTLGIYSPSQPEAITINADAEGIQYGVDNETIILHEVGHAVVYRACHNTQAVPAEYSQHNDPGFEYGPQQPTDSQPEEISPYGEYAESEAIAELYAAIFARKTPFVDKSSKLDSYLSAGNDKFIHKTAVSLALLDELQPGLGEIGLQRLADRQQ